MALPPAPVRAWDRRTLSSLVWQMWAWCHVNACSTLDAAVAARTVGHVNQPYER